MRFVKLWASNICIIARTSFVFAGRKNSDIQVRFRWGFAIMKFYCVTVSIDVVLRPTISIKRIFFNMACAMYNVIKCNQNTIYPFDGCKRHIHTL